MDVEEVMRFRIECDHIPITHTRVRIGGIIWISRNGDCNVKGGKHDENLFCRLCSKQRL